MRRRSLLLIPLLMALAPSCIAQEEVAPREPWGLVECIEYALANSPRLKAEEHRLSAAGETVREADSADDLKLGLDAAAAVQRPALNLNIPNVGPVVVRPPRQGSVSVQAALPIDISGQYRYIRRAARYSERAQREQYRQMQQLLLEVIDGYYGVLMGESTVRGPRRQPPWKPRRGWAARRSVTLTRGSHRPGGHLSRGRLSIVMRIWPKPRARWLTAAPTSRL